MSWQDAHPGGPAGRPGGDWQGVRPTFDNPMTWSLTLGRFFGITVRIHVVFLIFIVIRLARALGPLDGDRDAAFMLVAADMVFLFFIVLLHEYGHCIACKRSGGEADEILMWPLGGLAYCRPRHQWRAHMATVLGGPTVNVILFALVAPAMWFLTRHGDVAIPNPFGYPAPGHLSAGPLPTWSMYMLYSAHSMNLIVLLFNLLPIFPLDGGRICQAWLWRKRGYARSMRLSVYIGYFGAIGLFILGAVVREPMLIAIAAFGGITCYLTVKQLDWTEGVMGEEASPYAQSAMADVTFRPGDGADDAADADEPHDRREAKRAGREERQRAEEQAELDRILAKISEGGMDSLGRREKRILHEATARRKAEEDASAASSRHRDAGSPG